ncbi:MAG: hypothetical protein LBL82_01320 [Oscillospiraceae bacterium]|jgi:hypothetical protein|nr:hypothetical protein [Oscillospiraceae bacterium]
MGIFEDVVLNAKTAANTVGKKAGEIIDISKLRLSAGEINGEIGKRYEALGRVVYDSKKDGTNIDALAAECVKSIDALYERLDIVNAKLAKLRHKYQCGSCGASNEIDSVYCNRCGKRLYDEDSADNGGYGSASSESEFEEEAAYARQAGSDTDKTKDDII